MKEESTYYSEMREGAMVKRIIYIIGLILLTVFALSCNKNGKPKDFDYGRVENNKYLNSFFDFEMALPSDWIVQTKEQTENLVELGKELIAGDDKNMKVALSASEINVANLLVVFQYEVGAAVEFNPNLMLIAENIKNSPGIKIGSDYLFHARKLFEQSQIQYDFIDDVFKKEIIDNQDFYLMNLTVNNMGLHVKQKYYSTIQNGFCLNVVISYVSDEQKIELEKVINSMKFNR